MKVQHAVLGLLVSATVAVPVIARVKFNPTPTANSVCIWDAGGPEIGVGTPPPGIFANWTSHLGHLILTFGQSQIVPGPVAVGVRIDAPAGIPANNWTMAVNTTNGAQPFFVVMATAPGTTAPQLTNLAFTNPSGPPTTTYPSSGQPGFGGYSVTSQPAGYSQYTYNAQSANLSNYTWSSVYFGDSNGGPKSTFSDIFSNATINGVTARANIQPTPELDSVLGYTFL